MRATSCFHFLTILRLVVLRRLTILQEVDIDTPYFEQMANQIYPTELQLIKTNHFEFEVPFLDLSIKNVFINMMILVLLLKLTN